MRIRCATFLCAFMISARVAVAGPSPSSFEVGPTTLDLEPGTPDLFYIANRGTAPVSVQIQAMDWHQAGNADSLTPSQTFYASPPLVHVAPGERQTVRVLAEPSDTTKEGNYRLIASQLPEGDIGDNAVRVLLQFSVPVFVTSAKPGQPDVVWSASLQNGAVELSAHNKGANALKLTNIRVSSANSTPMPVTNGLAYVLPGATRSWRVAIGTDDSQRLQLTAHDDRTGASLQAAISLQR